MNAHGKIRILLVDDNVMYRETLTKVLARQGYNVDEASNGVQALEQINKTAYNLVITDIRMPVMDGRQLLEEMEKAGHKIPVIMITGFKELATPEDLEKLGVSHLILKPFTPRSILKLVSEVLDRSREAMAHGDVDEFFQKTPMAWLTRKGGLSFPIYIKLDSNKYMKIADTSKEINEDLKKILDANQVWFIYLLKTDYHNYLHNK